MSSYKELKDQITEKAKASSRYSRSDMITMAHGMLNDTDYEVKSYIKDVTNPIVSKPADDYRESLKGIVKQFGVDGAELEKVHTINIDKKHAEAVANVGVQLAKDYIDTGRKLIFPINSTSESQMEISKNDVAEWEGDTMMNQKQEDGTYVRVSTGKHKKKKAHAEIKASNKLPAWLVEETSI